MSEPVDPRDQSEPEQPDPREEPGHRLNVLKGEGEPDEDDGEPGSQRVRTWGVVAGSTPILDDGQRARTEALRQARMILTGDDEGARVDPMAVIAIAAFIIDADEGPADVDG